MAVNVDKYDKLALTEDQWYMKSQEARNLLVEVSQIVRGALDLKDAKVINQYWRRHTSEKTPKLFSLTGDEETIMALLGAFENFYLPTPNPGSIFAVDFYKCAKDCLATE